MNLELRKERKEKKGKKRKERKERYSKERTFYFIVTVTLFVLLKS